MNTSREVQQILPASRSVLIVKLSSLGDVVHAMPVVADIRSAHPDVCIDWVVEEAYAPMVRRVEGVRRVIECSLRRWRKTWWDKTTREEWRAFRRALAAVEYDAILDLQGLTKSAVVARLARGMRYGLANRTDGSSYERPARWLVDRAVHVQPKIHVVDRSRVIAAEALGYHLAHERPTFGLTGRGETCTGFAPARRSLAFVHGTSRQDKLWPESHWIQLGRLLVSEGWRVALPHAGEEEHRRSRRLAEAIGEGGCDVWPNLGIEEIVDWMAATSGVIGVDSGLSHIAVALGLAHVQIYNLPTSWRTGPQPKGSSDIALQVSVEGHPPSVDAVLAAWHATQAAMTRVVGHCARSGTGHLR